MGYNTTVVVLNDALHEIASDPLFGKRLADAITGLRNGQAAYVSAHGERSIHCNAAMVVETHHASNEVTVIVGGNTGRVTAQAMAVDDVADARRYRAQFGKCGWDYHDDWIGSTKAQVDEMIDALSPIAGVTHGTDEGWGD